MQSRRLLQTKVDRTYLYYKTDFWESESFWFSENNNNVVY